MDKALVEEIIASQPDGRMLFTYYPDRYAVWVLSRLVEDEARIAELRKTTPLVAKLLERPLIKELLARSGDGILQRDMLDMAWAEPARQFLLDYTIWGDDDNRAWNQTSRKGYNLVVQLNFSNAHEEQYQRLLKPEDEELFKSSFHPVKMRGDNRFRETLAWARIDLDFEADEALIEEIQSDWIREAQDMLTGWEKERWDEDDLERYGVRGGGNNLRCYVTEVLAPYRQLWEEAMMSAAIQVITEEIGISTIFYHSFELGATIKSCNPPRRLYTKLPRKFGFEKTETWPKFLSPKAYRKMLRRVNEKYWFRLAL